MRVSLPVGDDVAFMIASYLDPHTIRLLRFIHPVFWQLAASREWAKVATFRRDDVHQMYGRVRPLGTGRFVRVLSVRPWPVSAQISTQRRRDWIKYSIMGPEREKKHLEMQVYERLRQDVVCIRSLLGHLSGVKEFSLHWDENEVFHTELYTAFLDQLQRHRRSMTPAPWSAISTLSLKLPPTLLNRLPYLQLDQLHTFDFHFATGDLIQSEIHAFHEGLLVLLHNLKDVVRQLSFTSTAASHNFDMSWLFHHLSNPHSFYFLRLKSLSVSIPADGSQLSDPQLFTTFLERHIRTLQHIAIHTNDVPSRRSFGYTPNSDFIPIILAGISMPFLRLRSFEVSYPFHGNLEALGLFILRSLRTLTSLSIQHRVFHLSEIRALFRNLAYEDLAYITHLQLATFELDGALLTDLAVLLPGLSSLQIDYRHASHIGAGHVDLRTVFRDYIRSPSSDKTLRLWNLRHLSIVDSFKLREFISGPLSLAIPRLKLEEISPPRSP